MEKPRMTAVGVRRFAAPGVLGSRRTIMMFALVLVATFTVFALGRYSAYLSSSSSLHFASPTAALAEERTKGRRTSTEGTLNKDRDSKTSNAIGRTANDGSIRSNAAAVVDEERMECANPLEMYDNEGVDDDDEDDGNNVGAQGGGRSSFPVMMVSGAEDQNDASRVFDGVRHFVDKCVVQGPERLEVVARAKLKPADRKKRVVEHPGAVAFLVRDVCALGHFPKDLTHFHSWRERQRRIVRQQGNSRRVRAPSSAGVEIVVAGESDDAERARRRASLVDELSALPDRVDEMIIGHRCATKDASRVFNKRTPVFHKVLLHWVRAVSKQYDFLSTPRGGAPPSSLASVAVAQKSDGRTPVTTFEDKDGEVHCYGHLLEREERWRWFPDYRTAHSFRQLMWDYLGVNHSQTVALRHSIAFPKQRKLRILVLHRDEDRHFDEPRVVAFLQEKFGAVADVRLEQYDTPPNPKKITAENNVSVPHHRDQLLQLYQTDVLIAAHGAALSSVVVMEPGAVVIELFPHNFRYYMYEELSRIMSLNYVAYEGEVVYPTGCCKQRQWKSDASSKRRTDGADGDKDEQEDGARNVAMVQLNGKRDCKKCSIFVKEETWYQLVKNALASVWLRNSRLTNVHDFDVRR